MFNTTNDLPVQSREKVCELLNGLLATLTDLSLQSKQAHWNVRGPRFSMLHSLFDQVYSQVTESIDEVAERIVQLGGVAEGTIAAVTKKTNLVEFPLGELKEDQIIEKMTKALSSTAAATRSGIGKCDEWGDDVTSDLLTEITSGLDKSLWMVESHLAS